MRKSAGSCNKPRRVIAKVEWHPGELYPRVGIIVTNMSRPAENVVAFYNKRLVKFVAPGTLDSLAPSINYSSCRDVVQLYSVRH